MATPVSLAEARRLTLVRGSIETIPLSDALGRVAAEPLVAALALPAFDNSAMDGYAVRAADTPGALRVVGEARAGAPSPHAVGAGEAIRVSTGARLPAGADAVARSEICTGEVSVEEAVACGRDVRRAAEEVAPGGVLVGAGVRLGALELGALAAAGVEAVAVKRVRTAIIATGDELGASALQGGVPDSNRTMLAALAGDVVSSVRVGDDEAAIAAAISDALERADLVVTCGGMSVGPHDHVRAALERAGVELRFAGVAISPGRPVAFGVHPGGGAVLGLPGNPLSAYVAHRLLLGPHRSVHVPVETALQARRGVVRVVPVRLGVGGAAPVGRPGHGPTAALGADGLALVEQDLEPGAVVEVELLS
jgi:molybdopterin molybdotransferase